MIAGIRDAQAEMRGTQIVVIDNSDFQLPPSGGQGDNATQLLPQLHRDEPCLQDR